MANRYAGLKSQKEGQVQEQPFPGLLPPLPQGPVRGRAQEPGPQHWLDYSAYRTLRQGVNPEVVLKDRCNYLMKVMEMRKKLEEQLRSAQ